MSILQLAKTLPDGRHVEFHAPARFHLDIAMNHMQIIVESYETEVFARSRTFPSETSTVDVPLPDWSATYANNLLNFVHADPAWRAATVLP